VAELRFDITGNTSSAQRAVRDLAGPTEVAARGARLLADSLDKQRRAAATSVGATLTLAKADKILADAEHALTDGALEAEFALKRETEAAKKSGNAAVKAAAENRTLASSLKKIGDSSFLKPSVGGTLAGLSPALIPLAGSIAGAVGAIGISFGAAGLAAGAFGLMARSVLSGTSQDLAKLQALNLRLNRATTAAQRKSAEQAIAALKSTWSKGYLNLIDNYQTFQKQWKSVSQAITVPALNAWLPALTKGLQFLKPAIQPVADLFKSWGQSLNKYFSNPITVLHIKNMAAAFGSFAAIQLGQIAKFIGDIAQGFFNLGKDLAGSGANLGAAGTALMHMGDAFLAWSKSAKARADVQGFMAFIHKEGPVVTGILRDVAKLLPGMFAGATTVGTLELKALGDFFNLIAKLPPGWQKGLTEAAGALLLLSKTGVISVGLKIVGVAASWVKKLVGGASVELGGAAAAAEMRAAFATGGAAAAAEIRAAMTGGAAGGAAGAEGAAASGVGRKGLIGTLLGSGALAGAGLATFLASITHLPGQKLSVLASDFKGLRDSFHQTAASFDISRHAISGSFAVLRHDAASTGHDVAHTFDFLRHTLAGTFDMIRHGIATAWDTIWRNTVTRVQHGINDVINWFGKLPGRVIGALHGFGHSLGSFASAALNEMWNGFKRIGGSITSWFSTFGHTIINVVKKVLGVFSPSSVFFDIGVNLMKGLEHGIQHGVGKAQAAAQAASSAIAYKAGGGVAQWRGLVLKALRMEGLPTSYLGDVLYQMQTESGGNPNAINLTDINAQLGHPSIGLMQVIEPTFGAYHWPGTSWNIRDPLANIAAALNYAAHNRGFGPGPGQIGSGHGYALGGLITEPIWGVGRSGRRYTFGERGPETVTPGTSGGHIVLEFRSGGGQFSDLLVEVIRREVKIRGGGNVQLAFGRRGA
jgi:SLT domain-containing protein